ncbi:alanine--tRNA ligase [Candidatus Woesearchaeota archaeon]|nr:alanine--tRNA ligase [Candidatus Woesearchaeota archaeon]
MQDDKQLKSELRKKASENPEKYYAVNVLREEGFARGKCSKCGKHFWSTKETATCGDPACSGGFRFIGKSPAKNKIGYIDLWKGFSGHFKKLGYEPIKRYPVAARWRDDTDFVQASIYDFQPYVVSGEVEPPANPLVVPQFCLRFNDIDNVGITGAHYTGFVMIGQHAFMPPGKWKQEDYFKDIHSWLKKGIGLPNDEIVFHEDAWAGGGNFGPCMEFFSRGLELGNQVYMQYEVTPAGYKDLNIKVLDMGMGQERNAWFTTGESTSYEAVMPSVCEYLYRKTGVEKDSEIIEKFLPYSSYLNIDEAEDIEEAWKSVAKRTGINVEELKGKILPLAALYSVAEHSRSLLVALSDGVLPSNVAGGYNLRVILRRALSLIDKYKWEVSMGELAEKHAEFLKEQFPELSENLEDVKDILEVEKKKYHETRKRASHTVQGLLTKGSVTDEKLVELYDSQGISPEMFAEEAEKLGKKIKIPDDFYKTVAERHEKKEQRAATEKKEKLELKGVPETKALFFDDYKKTEFIGKVLKIIANNVLLENTYFYPTSGGQENDLGTINGEKVVNVFKQGSIIMHAMETAPKFKEGDEVKCIIDRERRLQLSQHHTSTHIVNGVCRRMLGNHAMQAGAAKYPEKARIDITHYESLTDPQLKEIEDESNKIIKQNLNVKKYFMPRTLAEQKFGFSIYQGGAVPGKSLRIVEIEGLDVECCGGTHLDRTSEAGQIKIIKTSKIQDGIIRIEFTAGKAAKKEETGKQAIVQELAAVLSCEPEQVPGRAEELFEKWKQKVKKGKEIEAKLISTAKFDGDVLAKTAEIFRTQPEHLVKTAKRFIEELAE